MTLLPVLGKYQKILRMYYAHMQVNRFNPADEIVKLLEKWQKLIQNKEKKMEGVCQGRSEDGGKKKK